MKRVLTIAAVAAFIGAAPILPAFALTGASSFTLVNRSGSAVVSFSIRSFGDQGWRELADGAAPGAARPVRFSDPDCAFDIRASLAGGGDAVWSGVNLCEAKLVVLNRRPDGMTWVDYR